MKKNYIKVQKTARYFTQGELDENTKYIWLIIHGYAQTAESFISHFQKLGSDHYVIAPEGLNKFYSRGFIGSPVASWMTSLERESEIEDYCNYLQTLVQTLDLKKYSACKKIVLGFSQGVSTQTRFINASDYEVDFSIMLAGEIAKEFQEEIPSKLAKIPSLFLVGTGEQIIKEEKIATMKNLMSTVNFEIEHFEGKHEVNQAALDAILVFLDKNNPEI